MKRTLLKRKIQACYLRIGLLALAALLLLASVSLGQLNDTKIAFMSNRRGARNGEIFLMNLDGKRVRRLTKHPQYDSAPAWSPDGQKIAFMSFRDEHRFQGRANARVLGEIYVMNTDGANPINLTQSPQRGDSYPSWSPDGKKIAFASEKEENSVVDIWIMEADGSNPINLTNHHAGDITPSWSPDGKKIAFSSSRSRAWEFERAEHKNWEIYVINTNGTKPIRLTNHPARDLGPDWSPDGKQIAFTSYRDENAEIYVMNADGTNPINLTNHPAGDRSPTWAPDGLQIAFSSTRDRKDDEDKNVEIYVMNADGANPINLTNNPAWDSAPSWGSVRPLGVSSNGRLVTLWGKVKRSNTYGGR